MSKLSNALYNDARMAASHLHDAQKSLRVLKALSWGPEVGAAFLAGGGAEMPNVHYPQFDGAQARAHIKAARGLVNGEHPVQKWLQRTADKLELAAAMLGSVGTADFYTHSKTLYGTPEQYLLDKTNQTIDLARHLDKVLAGLSSDNLILGGSHEIFGAGEFAKRLGAKLKPAMGADTPRIEITSHLSSKALAGRTCIRIRESARFSAMDVRQLFHHEAMVHTATAINGREQKNFPILGSAHAGTTEIQEGLAVFAEIITGAMDPFRFKRLVDRVIAIQMSVEGADFIQVYRYFIGRGNDERGSYESTRRVFRGGVLTGGAPFTKDGVYLNGLLRVHNFMRTVIKLGRGDLIRLLFVGKLDLEDVPALAEMASHGRLKPPRILPPWVKDMRFLVSYLAYSSFLNRVKLPGFQDYYADLLVDVPDIWDFAKC
ncbi:MAG: flavohemoglobin expression-modulating QEGLA motif protein [Robiginitomaculum sp.]